MEAITIISIDNFIETENHIDIKSLVDLSKLRRNLKKLNYEIPKNRRIKYIFTWKYGSPNFMNFSNKIITYKYPVAGRLDDDGVYIDNCNGFTYPAINHPIGYVVIVYK